MVEPVTICIAIAVGISTLIGVLTASRECYKSRFMMSAIENYDVECPEYPILWNILSYSDHVNSRKVNKRDKRKMNQKSEKVLIITCVAEFEEKIEIPDKKSYTFELVSDRDDLGQPCIRLICSNNEKLEYFRKRLFADKINPSSLLLIGCSAK